MASSRSRASRSSPIGPASQTLATVTTKAVAQGPSVSHVDRSPRSWLDATD
jgi:hypothetical protein